MTFDVIHVNGIVYQAIQTWKGYEIQLTKAGAKHSMYLKHRRNGQNVFTHDYLYAKHYATEKKALEVIEELMTDNLVEHLMKGESK